MKYFICLFLLGGVVTSNSKPAMKPSQIYHNLDSINIIDSSATISIRYMNVHILDIANKKVLKNRTIITKGDKITSVTKKITGENISVDTIINCNGAFVIPMITDMHHHLTTGDFDFQGNTPKKQLEILKDQKKFGIQAVLNPNVSIEATRALLNVSNNSKFPHTSLTGPSIGPKGGWGSHSVTTKDEILVIVDSLSRMGTKHIKFTYDDMAWLGGNMPVLSDELMEYLIITAHNKNMKVLAHVTDMQKAKKLLRYGIEGIVHGIISEEVDEEFLKLMKRNRAIYVPTTAMFETCFDFQKSVKEQFQFDNWNYFNKAYRDSLTNSNSASMWESWWPDARQLKHSIGNVYLNTKKVQESGNIVFLGSDTGTPGVLPGVSALYEMVLMEKSGLSPYEVLDCAVTQPLKFLGLNNLQGCIKRNMYANMIFLREDPTLSIENIKSTWMIVHNGKIISHHPQSKY